MLETFHHSVNFYTDLMQTIMEQAWLRLGLSQAKTVGSRMKQSCAQLSYVKLGCYIMKANGLVKKQERVALQERKESSFYKKWQASDNKQQIASISIQLVFSNFFVTKTDIHTCELQRNFLSYKWRQIYIWASQNIQRYIILYL